MSDDDKKSLKDIDNLKKETMVEHAKRLDEEDRAAPRSRKRHGH